MNTTEPLTPFERVLLRRINRKLARDMELVRIGRQNGLYRRNFGRLFWWSKRNNGPIETHVDLIAMAGALGVLHGNELTTNLNTHRRTPEGTSNE